MTIRNRLLVGFVLIGVLPALLISIGSAVMGYIEGRQQVLDRLVSVAQLRQFEVEDWMDTLQTDLLSLINEQYARDWMEVVLDLAQEQKYYEIAGEAIRSRLLLFLRQSSFSELYLVNDEGIVSVASSAAAERLPFPWDLEGMHFSTSQSMWLQVVYAADGTPHLLVAQEVLSLEGEHLGYLAGTSSLDAVQKIVAVRTGLGQTGKAYLIDRLGFLLTPISTGSRRMSSNENAVAGQVGDPTTSQTVQTLIQSHISGSGIYQDDRGRRVLGVYAWIPGLEAGLMVEQDLGEAFRAIMTNLGVNLGIVLFALLFAVSASLATMRSIATPLEDLAQTAAQIASGNLQQKAAIDREDEIGMLANSFNSMTTQLSDLINTLETRVEQRTHELENLNEALRYRALQLETSAQVSREATSILKFDELLSRVVELIRDAFGYYHVNIYLLEKETKTLRLTASSGTCVPHNKILALEEKCLNSQALQVAQAMLVNDVEQDLSYMADEKLPSTQSELVIPLRVGENVIGTLDVHADQVNAFRKEDVLVIQSLGDQIAIAIENLRLYETNRELAVMEERNRLARELHDSVTQSLYSLSLMAAGLRKLMQSGETGSLDRRLALMGESTQQALQEMRLLIYELRPPALEKEGLAGALRQRLDAVENRAGVQARLLVDDFIDLPGGVEAGLYRIAQEALNNALKHAGAKHVDVRIYTQTGDMLLEIQDDGCGFDLDAARHAGGMGLNNMTERAGSLGGSLQIDTGLEEGTLVQVRLPLEDNFTIQEKSANRKGSDASNGEK